MSEFFVKVPPDSTGKAIRHSIQIEVDYQNPINPGAITFVKGELVTFAQSGMTGVVALDHFAGGIQHTEPHVHLMLSHGSPETLTPGEDMLVDGIKRAEAVVQTQSFYVPVVQMVGGDNPVHSQAIDKRGAASVTFHEGEPMFDAFGKTQISESTVIGEYTFNYDGDDRHFSDEELSGATVVHDQTIGCMTFTNPTTTGSKSARTTDRYHKYIPGIAQFAEMTVAMGDAGKANVRRRWGYFDEENGIFFELDGTTLNLVIRSNTSGSVVETRIAQDSWNTDQVDGTGGLFNPSEINLDVSKDNIYWLDFQWLGAGRVRAGIKADQTSRIVCHTFNNANLNDVSYMRTGSLPLRYEQENTGTSASISQMKWFCSSVKQEGRADIHRHRLSYAPSAEGVITNTKTPLFSIRPKSAFKGKTNRSVVLPVFMSVSSFNNTTPTSEERILVEAYENPTLTSPTWTESISTDSVAEIDIGASGFTGGLLVGSMVVSGIQNLSLDEFFNYTGNNIHNKHDGTLQHLTFVVKTLRAGISADVFGSITWEELVD